ncbi:MAG TPA: hypothetical protein VEQ63_10350, partial [Bryobacteraceae bacterium]|nr:hypothetical protein [Bryobacteraceae bacterium]
MKAQSKSLHSGAVTVAQNDMPAEARVLASVRRNTAMLAISRIGSVLLDGLGYVLTARYFGPADYGIYVSLLGFINLMDAAADMTVLDITAREMAREPEHTGRWLVVSTVLRIILGLCGFLAYAVYLQVTPMSGELMSTAWIGAWILAASALRMPVAVFQASMKLHFELAIMLVSRAF